MLVHDNRFLGCLCSSAEACDSCLECFAGEGSASESAGKSEIAVVLVNNEASDNTPHKFLRAIWERAAVRICADGAANNLIDGKQFTGLSPPDAIVGDLDSLRPDSRKHFASLGTEIVHAPDQDFHDLDKSLMYLERMYQARGQNARVNVVILGAFGGRLDQEISNINMLIRWSNKPPFDRILLAGKNSLAFAIPPGSHKIIPDPRVETKKCGLLPIFGRCECVTTSGLRWNLESRTLEFGGLVSSSNEVLNEPILVSTDNTLLWTTAIQDSF